MTTRPGGRFTPPAARDDNITDGLSFAERKFQVTHVPLPFISEYWLIDHAATSCYPF